MLQLNFSPFPQLTTDRLVLRQLVQNDVIAIAALRNNETVNQYIDRPKTSSRAEALQFIDKITKGINNNESMYWVITLKDNDSLIGTLCLWNFIAEEDTAETGYELHPAFHGKGIMHEALQAVIDFGFKNLRLNLITAFTSPANIASIKLLEKNNFKMDTTGKYSQQNTEGEIIYVLGRI